MLRYVFLLSLFLFPCTLKGYELVDDQCSLSILTPSLSERKTKKIRLENGLEAYLISDPGTHQSGAALAVAVGSFDDPDGRPGMAHFVEHMLFMGTEKYPDEEEYHRYLVEHGGKCNAFTADNRTVYIFAINNESFDGALDRFSEFFISPLFRSSSLQREAQAIDQEFCKDLPLDPWRTLFVKKELANPQHPFHRFCIGNKLTLSDVKSEELKKWYEEHYSSHLMHLVIYSSEPIEKLEKLTVERFSPVKKTDFTPPDAREAVFLPEARKQMIAIKPLQELKKLELTWELPSCFAHDRECHVDQIIGFVIGHEGENSLFATLKNENLAEGLGCSAEHVGRNQILFTISIDLTQKGLDEYEKVITRSYEALSSFSEIGIPEYIFDEMRQMKKNRYIYQSREDVFTHVSELAYTLVDEPLETYPEQTLMPRSYNPEKIKEFLAILQPQNCYITLIADPTLLKIKTNKKEKWMGVEYTVLPLSNKILSLGKKTLSHKTVSLPQPNPFLPENLALLEKAPKKENALLPIPKVVSQNEKGIFYFASDDRFFTPEITWILTFKTPAIHADEASTLVLADFYTYAIEKKLNSLAYMATLGGLDYKLQTKENGLQLKIEGYSGKAFTFLQALLEEMSHFRPSEKEFASCMEFYKVEYKNQLNKTPVSQGTDVLLSVIYKDYASLENKEKALKNIKYDQFTTFSEHVLEKGYIEGMLYGNMNEEEAISLSTYVEEKLNYSAYPPLLHFKKALACLPSEKNPAFFAKKSQFESNALILLLDAGPFTFERNAALEILSKGLQEPFFTELRTKQQTAYLVRSWSQEVEHHLYAFFLTQSSSHDNRDLISRYELFFESSLQNLKDEVIPESTFETLRTALIVALDHPAENFDKMAETLNQLAYQYDGDFAWIEKKKKALQEITYEQFLTFSREFIGKENHRRLAICINGVLPPKQSLLYRRINTLEKVREGISYQEKKN